MTGFLQVFYSFFSGCILALGIQNEFLYLGSPFLGLISLIPLYLALYKTSSFKRAGILVSIQITTVHVLSSFWLGNFKDFAIFTLGGTTVLYLIWGYFLGQLLYCPFSFFKKDLITKNHFFSIPCRVLYFAGLWTLIEWYKSTGWLAYPWGTLIMSAYKWSYVTQIVSITGTWGISFLFTFFAAVVAEGIVKQGKKVSKNNSYTTVLFCCIALFSCTIIFGIGEYHKKKIPIDYIETVIVQQNLDSWDSGNDSEAILLSLTLTDKAIAEANRTPNLVIWSESVLNYTHPESATYYHLYPKSRPLVSAIYQLQIPFIIGGPVTINKEKQWYSNAALLFDKNGMFSDFYGKIQLVPFAESIPYQEQEWIQDLMNSLVGFSSGWVSGPYYNLFTIDSVNGNPIKISTPICFEDAFPYVCRNLVKEGSQVFYNITNDSWSLTKSAEYQHFAIASYRTIENRCTMVRSTNSGYSVVISPTGKILYDLPLFERASVQVPVPVYEKEITIYSQLGDWLPYSLLFLWLIYFIAVAWKTRHYKKIMPDFYCKPD
jgi:apolipoprotein N-acyltransferase